MSSGIATGGVRSAPAWIFVTDVADREDADVFRETNGFLSFFNLRDANNNLLDRMQDDSCELLTNSKIKG